MARASRWILCVAFLACGTSGTSGRRVVVVGAGWGGLSAAHFLAKAPDVSSVMLIDAAPRVGGLIRDGFTTPGGRAAEAGQHGFWDEYFNIFKLVNELGLDEDAVFSPYAEQGQYSPKGLEAVWPVFRERPRLPTGAGQALYTRFLKLPPTDLASMVTLAAALSDLDGSEAAYDEYDDVSFEALCAAAGVSRRAFLEVCEPMLLTGLFAPCSEVSAAAALGMAEFFVLRSQTAFDVRWCRGNVGEVIFNPWTQALAAAGVDIRTSSRVADMRVSAPSPEAIHLDAVVLDDGSVVEAEEFVFALGAGALAKLATAAPAPLRDHPEWAGFQRLRGTACLATRLWFDQEAALPFTANPAWGFESGVGTTVFDIRALHAPLHDGEPGAVIEVDWYNAADTLLNLSDEDIVARSARVARTLAPSLREAQVIDSAIVRLPSAATHFFPGSARLLPRTRSAALENVCFAGDYVRVAHGSWSQERAFVSGMEAANAVAGQRIAIPIETSQPEPHVAAARAVANLGRGALGPLTPTLARLATLRQAAQGTETAYS